MATLAQAQYLRVYAPSGPAFWRWQSAYAWQTVTWEGQPWAFMPFEASGFTAGLTGSEDAITLAMPALPEAVAMRARAMAEGLLLQLRVYQFDPAAGDAAPQAGQQLVAAFTGQAVGGSETLTELRLQLGSALAPIGAQLPPRSMSTRLIGRGCRLWG